MRHRFVIALLLLAAAARADQTINIGPAIAFSPSLVTVAPGETVTWSWKGSPHSTTSNATSGPEFWDSGIQLVGATFSHTFNTPGSYPYYCKVHSCPTCTTMNGVIQVAALTPTPNPTVTPPLTSTPLPSGGPAAIPDAGRWGRLVLLLGLSGVALRLLWKLGSR